MELLNVNELLHHALEVHIVILALTEVVLAILLLEALLAHPGTDVELPRINDMLWKVVFGLVLLDVVLDGLHLLRRQEVRFGFFKLKASGDLLQNGVVKEHLPNPEYVE